MGGLSGRQFSLFIWYYKTTEIYQKHVLPPPPFTGGSGWVDKTCAYFILHVVVCLRTRGTFFFFTIDKKGLFSEKDYLTQHHITHQEYICTRDTICLIWRCAYIFCIYERQQKSMILRLLYILLNKPVWLPLYVKMYKHASCHGNHSIS